MENSFEYQSDIDGLVHHVSYEFEVSYDRRDFEYCDIEIDGVQLKLFPNEEVRQEVLSLVGKDAQKSFEYYEELEEPNRED